jgi:hypothetical protein
MRKILSMFVLLITLFLISCTDPNPDLLTIELYPGFDTVEIHTEFTDSGALSEYEGIGLRTVVLSNNVDTSKLGTYQVVYHVTSHGFTKQITRKVIVVDQTAPTGVLNPGVDTVYVGSIWVDAGVTALDNSLGTVTVVVVGTVSTEIEDEFVIEYILMDESGNVTRLFRYVNVMPLN